MSFSTGGLMMATQIAGAGLSLSNAYSQSTALRQQGRAAQMAAETNANWYNIQAQDAIQRGGEEERRQKVRTRQMISAQRAAQGAQGLDPNADSALLLQEDTAGMGALDALTIRLNAQREALGLKSRSLSESSQGRMAWMQARNQASQSIVSGGLSATRDLGYGLYGLSKYSYDRNPYYGDQG